MSINVSKNKQRVAAYLIHEVTGDSRDGDYLDSDQAGVPGGEDVGVAGPVERVHEDGFLGKHADGAVLLNERWEVIEVVRSHVKVLAHREDLGCKQQSTKVLDDVIAQRMAQRCYSVVASNRLNSAHII